MSAVTVIEAVGLLADLATAISNLARQTAQVSTLIHKAQSEGRDHLTAEEWAQIVSMDDQAKTRLEIAIASISGPLSG